MALKLSEHGPVVSSHVSELSTSLAPAFASISNVTKIAPILQSSIAELGENTRLFHRLAEQLVPRRSLRAGKTSHLANPNNLMLPGLGIWGNSQERRSDNRQGF